MWESTANTKRGEECICSRWKLWTVKESLNSKLHTCFCCIRYWHNSVRARSAHPYYDTETSCSTVEDNWRLSWDPRFWPHYNSTQPNPLSRRVSRLLQRDVEPVVEMGPSQPSLANYWSSGSCSSEQRARKPCSQPQISFPTEER